MVPPVASTTTDGSAPAGFCEADWADAGAGTTAAASPAAARIRAAPENERSVRWVENNAFLIESSYRDSRTITGRRSPGGIDPPGRGASARHPQEPRRAERQVEHQAERRRKRPEPVQIPLRQVAAPREEEIGARPLWRDGGEVVGREEEVERERPRADAELRADPEEDSEQRQQVRGLA